MTVNVRRLRVRIDRIVARGTPLTRAEIDSLPARIATTLDRDVSPVAGRRPPRRSAQGVAEEVAARVRAALSDRHTQRHSSDVHDVGAPRSSSPRE